MLILKCFVYRPKDCKTDALYLRPRKSQSIDCWYCDSPVGVHLLQQTVSKLCAKAGFEGFYTNHSLRATAATRLYNAGMDEQLVSEKTGHRSKSVRGYKRTSEEQLADVSNVLQGKKCSKLRSNVSSVVPKEKAQSPNSKVDNTLSELDQASAIKDGKKLSVSTNQFSFTIEFK